MPGGGTSISGTAGATIGASSLTEADGAESTTAGSTTASSRRASSVLVPPPLKNLVARLPAAAVGGVAGVVSPTTSGANGATGAACPMSPACSGPTSSTTPRSGANHSTPEGGSRNAADAGRPCHICGSASTTPRLPTPDPPYSSASVLSTSRQRPVNGSPTR